MDLSPDSLRGRVFNEVLHAIRLRSVVYCHAHWTAKWGYQTKTSKHPHFHFLTSGRCWLEVEKMTDPIPISQGDLVFIAPGQSYGMRDELASRSERLEVVLERRPVEHKTARTLFAGNGGESTTMLCGGFVLEESSANPLLASLPPALIMRSRSDASGSLNSAIQLMEAEKIAGRAGSDAVLARLMDVIFLQAIRSSFCDGQEHGPAWVGALLDPLIGEVLLAIHTRPEARWTVVTLGREIGMSRSAFSERFGDLLKEPPMIYVTRWRMNRAAFFLRSGEDKIAAVAARVGYDSEVSLSRAFKRCFGLSPGAYRRHHAANDILPRKTLGPGSLSVGQSPG